MFTRRIYHFLGFQRLESTNNTETCIAWFNNIIDITIRSSLIRISEFLFVFRSPFRLQMQLFLQDL